MVDCIVATAGGIEVKVVFKIFIFSNFDYLDFSKASLITLAVEKNAYL